jgi:hypothetical protein
LDIRPFAALSSQVYPDGRAIIMTNDMIQTKITTSDKTKIILSAKRNDFRSMKELLEKNPSLVNEQDIGGLTALHWVCANRNYHLFSELIKCPGINVLLKDKNGRLALDHAIAGGHKSIILTLMNFMHVMNDPASLKIRLSKICRAFFWKHLLFYQIIPSCGIMKRKAKLCAL